MSLKSLGFSTIAALAGPKDLGNGTLGGIPLTADLAIVQCEVEDVRWRTDGTDPTATVGMLLEAGDTLQVEKPLLSSIKFVEVTGGAILNFEFYKQG